MQQLNLYVKNPETGTVCSHNLRMNSAIGSTETNDCTVLALAATLDVDYDTAHQMASLLFGRQKRRGVERSAVLRAMKKGNAVGVKAVTEVLCHKMKNGSEQMTGPLTTSYINKGKEVRRKMSLKTFARTFNQGTYFVLVRGHALAVREGVVVDNLFRPRLKAPVQWAFKLEGEVE